MILKKPYAFFIKMFKPIHLLFALLIGYLIYLENKILEFLNNYLSTSISVVGEPLKEMLVNPFLYIIPIIIMISSFFILSIMFKKRKPVIFYVLNIFCFIVVIVINIYTINFLGTLERVIVSIKSVKLIHDLVFINIIIESIMLIFSFMRGFGLNIKKFNFDSDISKIEISDKDKEEIELNFKIDIDEVKRKRRKKIRYLKYAYVEKRFLINTIMITSLFIIFLVIFVIVNSGNIKNKEGVIYSAKTFSFGVDDSYIITTDHAGKKITDDYLIVVDVKMKSNFKDNDIYLNDFSLNIEDISFKPITKYSSSLSDLGSYYSNDSLTLEYTNHLFVYEIPEKYIKSDMLFNYFNSGKNISILLEPKELVKSDKTIIKNINEELIFDYLFEGIKFKVNNFEIKDKFLLEYNYCVKDNDCVFSKEYIKASIDENYDKYVLKLEVLYENSSTKNINDFYNLISSYGSIYYKIGDKWYYQSTGLERITSKRKKEKNIVYIGVNSIMKDATSIKFVFNIRGSKYEYILK